jgi:hypothetical protein
MLKQCRVDGMHYIHDSMTVADIVARLQYLENRLIAVHDV